MQRFISFLLTLVCGIITIAAQSDDLPTANPVMTYTDDDGQEVSETQYDGSAPFKATFKACPEHTGNYTPPLRVALHAQRRNSPIPCALRPRHRI